MIEVKGLRKQFGKLTAVDSISFDAKDGEVTGLLGPNGAGKTTTLRMLYGLLKADDGLARIDGVDVIADPIGARAIMGILPDAHGLYQRLTAREHIDYFGRLHGLSDIELGKSAGELIEKLDMKAIANRRTAGFSQGEKVKTAVARALVHAPRNILLDEPTSGLDVMSTRAMRELILRLRDEGKCILFSSHIMQEVSMLCDKIVIVARGRIVAMGTPDDIRELAQNEDLEEAFMVLARRGDDEEGRA